MRIKEIRLERGISQEKLAKEIGISKKSLARYEKNEGHMSAVALRNLALYLNVSVDYILEIRNTKK